MNLNSGELRFIHERVVSIGAEFDRFKIAPVKNSQQDDSASRLVRPAWVGSPGEPILSPRA